MHQTKKLFTFFILFQFLLLHYACTFDVASNPIEDVIQIDNGAKLIKQIQSSILEEPDTIVVFDIDYVLMTPKDALLRPAGEHVATRRRLFDQLASKAPADKDLKYYLGIIQSTAEVEVVDSSLPLFTQQIVAQGIPVVALSANEVGKTGEVDDLLKFYVQRLQGFGYQFSFSMSPMDASVLSLNGKNAKYLDGVVFTDRIAKGAVLAALLKQMDKLPKQVIFVDDRRKMINSAQEACRILKLNFIGLHYTQLASLAEHSNAKVAEFQIDYLRQHEVWLSDQLAQNLM